MEDQRIIYCNSILDHCKKMRNSTLQCNECTTFKSNDKIRVESHLFHKHDIFTTKSKFIWGDQSSIANRFFEPVKKYFARCKICGSVLQPDGRSKLHSHLETHQDILNIIRAEIANSNCVSRHFNMTTCWTKAYCKFEGCKFSCKTVNGINFLKSHLKHHPKRIHSESCTGTRSYNVDAMIQQPVAEENYASTSHSVRQPDTMAQQVTYCETIKEHCKFIKRRWHCTLCPYTTKSTEKIIMEAHLFHIHKKFTRQSNFIWDDNIIKRYFIGIFPNCKYYVKCTRCEYSRAVRSKYDLYNHLTKHETVLKEIRGEIKNSWVEKHFKMSSCYTQAHCTLCTFSCRTVMGIDHLKTHVTHIHKLNEHSKSVKEIRSYNVDATIQQPVAEENYASTSFHHDNRQTFGNQGDQQR